MKLVIYAWAALLVAGCTASTSNQTKLVFSGAFQLPLSADLLAGTSIFSIDGIAIKTSKGPTQHMRELVVAIADGPPVSIQTAFSGGLWHKRKTLWSIR